jgi:hypothetical protein
MKQKVLYLGMGLFTFVTLILGGLWLEHRAYRRVPSHPVVSRSAEEDRVAEALFRHLLQEHQGLRVYFLSRDGADPSDDFMRRFQGERPLVKKNSLSVRGKYRSILDKESGAIAGIVSVGPVKWISDSEVEVGGAFYDGEVIEYRYRMGRTNIGWIVTGKEFVVES